MAIGKDAELDILNDLDDYIKWAISVGDNYLFRGQADMGWKLRSGATRRVYPKSNAKISYPRVRFYIEDLLDRSKLKGFHYKDHTTLADLELLAHLQHNGAATILLDLTKNSLIALWFACMGEDNDGKVFALNIQNASRIKRVNSDNISEKFSSFIDKDLAYIWEPSHINPRIQAQASVFLIAEEPYILEQKEALIGREFKKKIRQQLESTFGISEETVFPDFPGFALANAANKSMKLKDEKHYFNLGLEMQRTNKIKEAVEYYDKAIELNPEYKEAYYNRANAKRNLGDSVDSIFDYNKAIELDPEYLFAYNNRGIAKDDLGKLAEAIEDYNKAIELNPESFNAYNNRGNAKRGLGKYSEALEDLSKAMTLTTEDAVIFFNRGRVFIELDKYTEALNDFDKAKELAIKQGNERLFELIKKEVKRFDGAGEADK